MPTIPDLTFHDGHSIPQLGFGLWQVSEDAQAVVESALATGYRLIDGAYLYGNEKEMGAGLKASGVPREEVFLTTKVWNNEQGREKARRSVERSLESIGVDQLDLVLIHWPDPEQDAYLETWEEFIRMRDEGLMRSIGTSNFNADHLDRIIEATGEAPVLNQIELNPELQQPRMRGENAKRNIITQAWTPLGNARSFEAEAITSAAERTGKSPAQVILRWHVQSGHGVIPRSTKPERQAANMDVFDFELSTPEMDAIAELDQGLRTGPDPSVFKIR